MATTKKIDGKAYSIGEILKKGVQYRVPTYQRDFAWSVDEIDTLWNDIMRGIDDEKKEYFIGAIVTSRTEEPKKRDIVDGQQRLAALSMIFAAIADAWKMRSDQSRESLVKNEFLGDVDRRTLTITPKLTLNENNDTFYQACVIGGEIVEDKDKKALISSNKLILAGYGRIKFLLEEWIAKNPESFKENLIILEEFISESIYAILIETGDESDAYVTFETLNGRGIELATSDLVKNFLFSKAGSNIDKFKKTWNEILLIIGSEGLTQFIRYFWNAYYDVAREKELYKNIKETIKETSSAKSMIDKLRTVAVYNDALSNPEHPYWSEFSNEYKQYLNALNLFKFSQYKPIMFAAMDFMNPVDLTKVLKVIMVISFRYTVISGLNTGSLERVYPSAALAITANRKIRPKGVFDLLKSVYVDDSKFEADFAQRFFNKDSIARYILKEINDSLSGSESAASAKITVEHILPKNPNSDWKKYLGGMKSDELVYLIGNLTLLDGAKNREIGNSTFEVKKVKAFNKSVLSINDSIKSQLYWSNKSIIERSESLAKTAVKIWRLDY
ncbi:DUF262 domain-containing protein [Hymenobacter monticola]|uniref:DUF262 domain-containing HNH endonuclease family protein n=1 Tax=Hymenobacter monticola TaxID=1705399 RepID=A0ABY4BD82_9BACT|nr:DUF262 domain-containing protein [Hymenobacter monticola]UOE35686.1 DUF262 domain-containing HNH endonuclease family protein [Hymenobacter monticola]